MAPGESGLHSLRAGRQPGRDTERPSDAGPEITETFRRAREHHEERLRLRELLGLTDHMVEELERLNLRDVPCVGAEWRSRLALLFGRLPFAYQPHLRTAPSPSEVLDLLFDVQGRLLAIKNSPIDPWLRSVDAELTRLEERD